VAQTVLVIDDDPNIIKFTVSAVVVGPEEGVVVLEVT